MGIYTSSGVNGILGLKEFCKFDIVIPFFAEFVDKDTGYIDERILTTIDALYFDLGNNLL